MAYFFDTSALIKRYAHEIGSTWVNQTLNPTLAHEIWISKITQVEMLSAIGRKVRDNTYPVADVSMFRRVFKRDTGRYYHVVQLTDKIVSTAQELCLKYPLRALDSMQLASAISVNQNRIQAGLSPIIFVCADMRLLNVAQSEGVIPLDVMTAT